jgi:hypothetical protein
MHLDEIALGIDADYDYLVVPNNSTPLVESCR